MGNTAAAPVQESAKPSRENAKLLDGFAWHLRRRNHPPRTIETYAHEARVFLAWLNGRHPRAAKLADLRAYQEYLAHEYAGRSGKRLSASSQSRNLTSVRMFYRYLKREGVVVKSPAEKLRLPRVGKRKRRRSLTLADVRAMIDLPAQDAYAIRDRALVYFLAATGVRATACANLDLSDVNIERREVMVRLSKGNRSYVTFITPGCGIALTEYIESARPKLLHEDDAPLFVGDEGQRMTRGTIRHAVLRQAERAGIAKKIHPHLFRHFLCTTLLERGANVRAVSEIAGHARLSTTTAYTEVTDELLQRIVTRSHPRGTP